jgi:hypothetical protein
MSNENSLILTKTGKPVTGQQITSVYVCEGLSIKELAERFQIEVSAAESFVDENKLDDLRALHIKHGLEKMHSIQLVQAEKIIDIETQFKKMRLIQLQKILDDHLAYYSSHGHFYKVHPINGQILRDTDGIPMQIRIPDVSKEIKDLKESVSLSQGLRSMLNQIEEVINKPKNKPLTHNGVIDLDDFNGVFKKKSTEE